MKAKFKVGEKVDYVNDFGVVFPNKTVTEVHEVDGGYNYSIEPTGTPWMNTPEKNLHVVDTYNPDSMNLKLNIGTIAKYIGADDWGRLIYEVEINDSTITAVLVDGSLQSISGDFDEPGGCLRYALQPASEKGNFTRDQNGGIVLHFARQEFWHGAFEISYAEAEAFLCSDTFYGEVFECYQTEDAEGLRSTLKELREESAPDGKFAIELLREHKETVLRDGRVTYRK